jgi:hypothetical protein
MKLQIKSIWGTVKFEGDFSSMKECILAALEANGANLCDANLSGVNLRGANLCDADLHGADLRDSDLRDSDLRDSDLHGADLRGVDLRGVDLRGADLHGANLPKVTPIKNLETKTLEAIDQKGCKLDMGEWHKCETTHCRSGWYITLAGGEGRLLESIVGPATAGALIYNASYPKEKVPNFYVTTSEAMADIKARAARLDK